MQSQKQSRLNDKSRLTSRKHGVNSRLVELVTPQRSSHIATWNYDEPTQKGILPKLFTP
jgi:hypothetical protein